MSSVASSYPVRTSINRGRVALAGLAAILAALVVNVVIYFVGQAFVAYDPEFAPLANVGAPVVFTAFFTAIAALVYALVLRFARNPVRTFLIVAVVGLVVTLIPDVLLVPTFPGATGGQIAVLVLMHLIAAPVIVSLLTTLAHSRRVRG